MADIYTPEMDDYKSYEIENESICHTAKELKNAAKTIKLYANAYIENKPVYTFSELELEIFCAQHAKEQRENCGEAYIADYNQLASEIKYNAILNAKQPEL